MFSAHCSSFHVRGGRVFYKHISLLNGFYINGMEASVHCPYGSYPDGPTKAICLKGKGWSAVATQCLSKYLFVDWLVHLLVSY